MVKRFPELKRIDQGLAGSVFLVKPVQAFALDQESGNLFAVPVHPDPAQVPAIAQEECTTENVRDFQHVFIQWSHLLSDCIFVGDTIEKESGFKGFCLLRHIFRAINRVPPKTSG